jgi:hypothetical protein
MPIIWEHPSTKICYFKEFGYFWANIRCRHTETKLTTISNRKIAGRQKRLEISHYSKSVTWKLYHKKNKAHCRYKPALSDEYSALPFV